MLRQTKPRRTAGIAVTKVAAPSRGGLRFLHFISRHSEFDIRHSLDFFAILLMTTSAEAPRQQGITLCPVDNFRGCDGIAGDVVLFC